MAKSFLEELEKKFGEHIIPKKDLQVFSTQSLSLDIAMGEGGIPRGKISTVYGAPGAGKTTLALCIAKSVIEQGQNVFIVDVENKLDIEYAEFITGVRYNQEDNRLVIVQPNTAEDAFSICIMAIESGKFSLIIFDSIGAISPKKEKEEADFEKQDVGLAPKLTSKFLRIAYHGIRVNNIAFLIINQVRAKIGSYVPTFSVPGGYALEHASSLNVMLSKGEDIKSSNEVIGCLVKFNIKKNSNNPGYKSGTYPLIYGKGIDSMRDLLDYAKAVGVVQMSGPQYKFGEEKLGMGQVASTLYLQQNPETLDKIKKACYNTKVIETDEE